MGRRWAVFISGTGSNLGAILDCVGEIQVALVVSSKKNATGLLKARRAGVPTLCLPKEINWTEVSHELLRYRVDCIFLAGFMKVLPADFLKAWKGRILNVHPSLLPQYPGLRSIEAAWVRKDAVGVTIHEVIPEVDAGARVLQRKVGWFENRDEMFLKTHLVEHQMVRKVIVEWKHNPTF